MPDWEKLEPGEVHRLVYQVIEGDHVVKMHYE